MNRIYNQKMLMKVLSGTTIGLDGVLIEVEVDVAEKGFPTFTIVGLPNKAIDEAKDRVRAAIQNVSFDMPDSRLTINLAPADIPKEGSGFDLPIAIGILAASGLIKKDFLETSIFLGELSLEGRLRKVPGILSMAILAKELGIQNLFIPVENAKETTLIDGITVFPIHQLADLILFLNGEMSIPSYSDPVKKNISADSAYDMDFSDIKGQEFAKRALQIAAAGFHNLHMKGPPGAGKTLLSRSFPSILPPMSKREIIEVSKIYSVAGLLGELSIVTKRPFRSPHHTTSRAGLIGGGTRPNPGEISLAHRGILFLDEFPEFPRGVLEALRQPLEDGVVTVSRAKGSITFPSRFILLCASNPCPCGYHGHPKRHCTCFPGIVAKYKKRLSGPLLDRIDLHIDVAPVDEEKLTGNIAAESTCIIRSKILKAYEKQKHRFINTTLHANTEMNPKDIKKFCILTDEAKKLMRTALSRLSLSARSYFKTIKIAQTIADLEGLTLIEESCVAEALQYRAKDE